MTSADATLEVLGKSAEAHNATEIASAIEESGIGNFNASAVSTALNRLKAQGRVDSVPETRPTKWTLPAGQVPSADRLQPSESASLIKT